MPTPATVDEWNLDKSLAFYKDRFADASDFTFVFVGSFDLPTMKPLVERYLGGLPSIRRKETWKDVGARPPTGVIEKTVEKGIEPKSQTAIVFTGPFEYDQTQRVAIRAMAQMLQTRLLETDSRGSRRHLQHHRRPELPADPDAGVSRSRSSSAAIRSATDDLRQARASRRSSSSRRTARPRSRSATRRKRCCATSRPTASRTATCWVSCR